MWISSRRNPSGREQKRFLNRAVSCGLCSKSLGSDRGLYETRKGYDAGLLVAHPECVTEEQRQAETRLQQGVARSLAASEAYAAEMRARSRLIVVDGPFLPSLRL
jgi:hypothetical protein